MFYKQMGRSFGSEPALGGMGLGLMMQSRLRSLGFLEIFNLLTGRTIASALVLGGIGLGLMMQI